MTDKLIPANPAAVMVIRSITPNLITCSSPFNRFGRIKVGGRGTIGQYHRSIEQLITDSRSLSQASKRSAGSLLAHSPDPRSQNHRHEPRQRRPLHRRLGL